MKVLVTGLSGFTGGYVKEALEAKNHVVVGLKSDLRDGDGLSNEIKSLNPEAVIHLAAIAFVGHGHANDFYAVNVIGTHNLLEAIYKNAPNVKSILLASSANVYGNNTDGVLTEESIPMPLNDYAVSKLAMENMAKLWIDRLPLFIVRPFNYTGVGQDLNFLIPKVVSHYKEKAKVIELGNIEVWREFNNVKMIADVYTQLLDVLPRGEVINVCTGKGYSLKEILQQCEEITGHRIDVKVNPKFIRKHEVTTLTGSDNKLKRFVSNLIIPKLKDTLSWMLDS